MLILSTNNQQKVKTSGKAINKRGVPLIVIQKYGRYGIFLRFYPGGSSKLFHIASKKLIPSFPFCSNRIIYPRYSEESYRLVERGVPLLRPLEIQEMYQREKNNNIKNLSFHHNKPLLLSSELKIIKDISLSSLSDKFRLYLEKDIKLFKLFSKFILLEHVKILYYLFKDEYSEKDMIQQIYKCFSIIKNKSSCNKEQVQFYSSKLISTVQHILNIIFYHKDFNISNLDVHKNIDFTHYSSKIPISVLIEYYIFIRNIKELHLESIPLNIRMIDHEFPLLQEKTEIFKQEESLKQTSQMNSDLQLYKFLHHSVGIIEIVKTYRDIKADYHGPATGHFTLKPYIATDLQAARQYMNNYTSFLTQFILKNPQHKSLITKDLPYLLSEKSKLQTNSTFVNIQNIIKDFNNKLLEMSLNQEYINKGINITIASDIATDEEFIKNILPLVEKKVEENYDLFDPNIVFPKTHKIDWKLYRTHIEEIINKIMPEELKERISTNFNKFIEYDK